MKVQSHCNTRPAGMPLPLRPNPPSHTVQPTRQENSPHGQINHLHALNSDYDNMEESLREALRQSNRPSLPKNESSRHMQPTCENTYVKRHNYINVNEQEQARQARNFRNLPNLTEAVRQQTAGHQPVVNGSLIPSSSDANMVGSLNSEEFRNYCAMLTERIQKMEEQNVHLLRLSEKQKVEYDKVAAQVVQSEESQRILLNECSNLRRQVQQLAGHNKMLREQQLFSSSLNSPNSPRVQKGNVLHGNGFFDENHSEQIPPTSNIESFEVLKNLHSSPDQRVPNGCLRDKCKASDVGAIVQLRSSLQNSTMDDLQSTTPFTSICNNSLSPDAEQPPLPQRDVNHEHSYSRRDNYEHSDYASPSSICATDGCSCCSTRPNFTSKPPLNHATRQPQQQYQAEGKPHSSNQQRIPKTIKSRDNRWGKQSDTNKSFDNNAYVEVEIRQRKQFNSSKPASDFSYATQAAVNVLPENRVRCTQNQHDNHPSSCTDSMRPSSLVFDAEATQPIIPSPTSLVNQFQPVAPALLTKSPLSQKDNGDSFQRPHAIGNRNGNNNSLVATSNVQQSNNQQGKLENTGRNRLPRKSSSSSLMNESRANAVDPSLRSSSKSFIRSFSITDLPSPPLQTTKQMTKIVPEASWAQNPAQSGLNRRPRSSSADATPSSPSFARTKFDEKRKEWTRNIDEKNRIRNEVQQFALKESGSKPDSSSSYRRGSYSAACRKSQSLDYLYEQATCEPTSESNQENEKAMDAMETGGSQPSTPFKHEPSCFPESPAFDAEPENNEQSTSDEKRSVDDVFVPSPKFGFENGSTPGSPYEIMMPLKKADVTNPETENTLQQVLQSNKQNRSPIKSRLQKRTDLSLLQKNLPPKSPEKADIDHNFEVGRGRMTSLPDAVTSDDQVFLANGERFRGRHHSEGSTANKQKDKLFGDTKRGQLRRHQSVGNDVTVNKRESSRLQTSSVSRLNSNKSDSCDDAKGIYPHPRFPSTNPHSRLQPIGAKPKAESGRIAPKSCQSKPKETSPGKSPSVVSKSPKTKLPQADAVQNSASNEEAKTSLLASEPSSVKENPSISVRGRSAVKSTKSNLESVPSSGEILKKKGTVSSGRESKSLVDLMKAKFSRSSSSGRSNASGKKRSNEKILDHFPKSGNTFIDPRTLSLEPNSYLPPGKDGSSIRKASKQKLGQNSDAAVGRKLSQPFPNGIEDFSSSSSQLNKVTEEVLSDEGFAEGSTIERTEKETPPDCEAVVPAAIHSSPPYQDPTFSSQAQDKQELSGSDIEKSTFAKKQNADWYENVVCLDKETKPTKDKRFQVVSSDNENTKIIDSPPTKQKHTRSKNPAETQYENYSLNDNVGPRFATNSENIQLKSQNARPLGREFYTTHVTLIRTSPPTRSQPPSSYVPQSNKTKSSLKIPKPASGGALSRIMKTVSNFGSKEDLTRGSSPTSSQGKEKKKIKTNDIHKEFENAFINSVVSAELAQNTDGRNSLAEPAGLETLKEQSPRNLPYPSSSSAGDSLVTGSIGTGSSFGSLPSDGIESNHSGDVIDYPGITSSGSSDSPTKQPSQRMSKNKRNSMTSYGVSGQGGKTGTGGSNASTSSSELCFKAKSRLPGSGVRSPKTVSPVAKASSGKLVAKATFQKIENQPTSTDSNIQRRSPDMREHHLQKITETKRSQSGIRISKMVPPSKVPLPGKVTEPRENTKKASDRVSPIFRLNQTPKTRLAPLNYGVGPPIPAKPQLRHNAANGQGCRPVYENSAFGQHQKTQEKRQSNMPSHRHPGSSTGIPMSPLVSTNPNQTDYKRVKKSIPSPGGFVRPRPVHSGGVGAEQ